MKTPEKKKPETKPAQDFDYLGIDNVRHIEGDGDKGGTVFFTLLYYEAKIYSCRAVKGENGYFVAFPSQKGKDGKYYNQAYVKLSDAEQEAVINAVFDAIP